jgi:hypothetical protein
MGKIVLNLTRKLVDPGPVNWEEWQDALDEPPIEKKKAGRPRKNPPKEKRPVGRPKVFKSDEERKAKQKENYQRWVGANRERYNDLMRKHYQNSKFKEVPKEEAIHMFMSKMLKLSESYKQLLEH